ncbi:MAG TPA: hypothetical protein VGR47_10545 [Terracidiphilus sp.]|nr:hypothetical protein [Terracidiphilus sp.]
MNHMAQLAADAQIAAYIMSSPDAQEIEILPLKPCMASDAECESLAARWSGRGLQGVGVIGRLADGGIGMALRVPFDHLQIAALLRAFTNRCEALKASEPQFDDSVTWLTALHALPDSRTN